MSRPSTLGELKQSDYRPRSVKQEMRDNVIARLRTGQPFFPGIVGFEDTVIPQIINAILSRHDMLFLGLRGQAKTRMLRALPELLDEYCPSVAGVEIPDDPIEPLFRQTRTIIAEKGDDTELHWIHRSERYHEKLATPDVTIADLIGEIDLVKHAEGRHLADESIIHYGLIPRTSRGIFAINELPDLAPRIQVGLFNVLEERDVQIRGFPIRIPLDLCIVFSANPEDYTNRGRIITPLKDRIGSVIRTHYPARIEHAIQVTRENAWLDRGNGQLAVDVPKFMFEIIEETIRLARSSPHINQQSGVSVRASIANAENMVSNAERRAISLGEAKVVPRTSDLANLTASCRGKIELMLAEDETAEDQLVQALIGEAIKNVFEDYLDLDPLEPIIEQFKGGSLTIEIGDDVSSPEVVSNGQKVKQLSQAADELCGKAELNADDPDHAASAIEFILEALHVNNRLSKYAYKGRTYYRQ